MQSIKTNYIYNTLYQILSLFIPFITAPYISRILGTDGVGEISYVTSIAAYFVLFASLGSASYAKRKLLLSAYTYGKLSSKRGRICLVGQGKNRYYQYD